MLSEADADQLFAQCERDLSRSKILIDDCLAKSGGGDRAKGDRGPTPIDASGFPTAKNSATVAAAVSGGSSSGTAFLLRTSAHLRCWRQSLALQDVLGRIVEVLQKQHAASHAPLAPPSTTAASSVKKGTRRWVSVMTQFLASLRQTLDTTTTPSSATSTSSGDDTLPSDTRHFLVLVTRYVWASVMYHVSAGMLTIRERGEVPVLAWIAETQWIHTCFVRGGCSHTRAAPELLLVDGSVSRQILDDVLDVLDTTPALQIRARQEEGMYDDKGQRGGAVDVDADSDTAHVSDHGRLAPYPVGGYPSLALLVALHAPVDIRTTWLVRTPCVDACAARLRQLFLNDGDPTGASRVACASATRSLTFVVRSCTRYAASSSASPDHRRLLERFLRTDVWDAFLGACESSCFGRGVTVMASRKGLAQFVYHQLYVPLFDGDGDGLSDCADDTLDATMLTARYRLLRLIGDLAESELGAGGGGVASHRDGAAAATTSYGSAPSSAHQEVHRKRYQALLASTNGVMTMPILQQLAHDKGILLEETAARSQSGHVVHRMFTVGSPDEDGGGGRLCRRRGGGGGGAALQQWVYIEKGNIYVKRFDGGGAATPGSNNAGYVLVTSLDDLLRTFSGGSL